MFTGAAQYYDKIYAFKDYRAEVQQLLALLGRYLPDAEGHLLDVACGTGHHLEYLRVLGSGRARLSASRSHTIVRG